VSEEVLIRRRRPSIAPITPRAVEEPRVRPRPQTHNSAHEVKRATPVRAYQPREPVASPLEFDPRDVPLPPVPVSPDFILPPVAPPFDFSPAMNETALLEVFCFCLPLFQSDLFSRNWRESWERWKPSSRPSRLPASAAERLMMGLCAKCNGFKHAATSFKKNPRHMHIHEG